MHQFMKLYLSISVKLKLIYTAQICIALTLIVIFFDILLFCCTTVDSVSRTGSLIVCIGVIFVIRDVQNKINYGDCLLIKHAKNYGVNIENEDKLKSSLNTVSRYIESYLIIFGTLKWGYADYFADKVFC